MHLETKVGYLSGRLQVTLSWYLRKEMSSITGSRSRSQIGSCYGQESRRNTQKSYSGSCFSTSLERCYGYHPSFFPNLSPITAPIMIKVRKSRKECGEGRGPKNSLNINMIAKPVKKPLPHYSLHPTCIVVMFGESCLNCSTSPSLRAIYQKTNLTIIKMTKKLYPKRTRAYQVKRKIGTTKSTKNATMNTTLKALLLAQ